MSNSLSAPGLCVAVALHAIALGVLLFAGTEETPVNASDADPILLMLGGEDPNKDAGLVGRERGIARGTQDGKIPEPNGTSRLDDIRESNERLAREEAAAAQRAAEEAAKQARAAAEAARQKAAKEAAAKTPTKNPPPKPSGSGAKSSGETVDISKLVQSNRDKGLYNNSGTSNSKPSGSGRKGPKIGEVKVGRVGGGSVLGRLDGTGGNGGDGGKRVADARMTYVEAVRARFVVHFENVVAQNQPSIQNSLSVNARFSVGKNGEIRFLEIEGSNNPQIRECIRKAFARAFPSRFQRPPNGDAFTGRLDGIEFLAQ